MVFSKLFTFILFSFTLSLLIRTSFGTNPYLFHICSNSNNFTANSTYESNLKTLINTLIDKTPSTGFGIGSAGLIQYQNEQAYGLTLCRGDVSASECKTCVSEATKEIQTRCPYNKGGIIWYDDCLFKYLDADFFGKIDNTNKFSLVNVNYVSDPTGFNIKNKEFLSQLAQNASMNPKLYAAEKIRVKNPHHIYGLTQCTRDLSSVDCKKCLDDAINELLNCCDGKEGGRVVGGSCNFRYEIYPFVED